MSFPPGDFYLSSPMYREAYSTSNFYRHAFLHAKKRFGLSNNNIFRRRWESSFIAGRNHLLSKINATKNKMNIGKSIRSIWCVIYSIINYESLARDTLASSNFYSSEKCGFALLLVQSANYLSFRWFIPCNKPKEKKSPASLKDQWHLFDSLS